jgi:hypothetical protein
MPKITKGKWDYVRKWPCIEQKMIDDEENPNIIYDQKYFDSILESVDSKKRKKSILETQLKDGSTKPVEIYQGVQTSHQKLNEASNNPERIDKGKQTLPQMKDGSTKPVEIDQGMHTSHQKLKEGGTNFDSVDHFPDL